MTTKSDRNLSYIQAVEAGLLPNPIPMVRINEFPKTVEHWETLAKDIKMEIPKFKTNYEVEADKLFEEPKKVALRFDAGKTNWSLMPFEAIEEINKVLEFGANKYAEWNFTNNGGMNHSRVINSLLRHVFAYMRGENNDKESGLSHLAHAGCNIVFLLYYNKYPELFKAKDDRHVR